MVSLILPFPPRIVYRRLMTIKQVHLHEINLRITLRPDVYVIGSPHNDQPLSTGDSTVLTP